MLPRLFNLCRMAQGVAAQAALGLAPEVSDADLRAEVLCEHLVALCVTLPPLLGRAPGRLPVGDVAGALFGRGLPKGLNGLAEWLAQGAGCAPLVATLRDALQPGEGVIAPLPPPPAPFAPGLWENSAAGRRADHPLLRAVEAAHGRGRSGGSWVVWPMPKRCWRAICRRFICKTAWRLPPQPVANMRCGSTRRAGW